MSAILVESVLFFALVAVVVALFIYALRLTPMGKRLRQGANRRRIDRMVDLTCPVHGLQDENDLVRISTGETFCPKCYREAVHGHVD